MEGYIKLWRQIAEWQWFKEANMLYFFVYLLIHANIEDKMEGLTEVKRGQYKTTLPKLSEGTGLTVKQVRTCLDKLELTGEIRKNRAVKHTIITICKFEDYQDKNSHKGQIKGRQRADKGHDEQRKEEVSPHTPYIEEKEISVSSTVEEGKEEKNNINIIKKSSFPGIEAPIEVRRKWLYEEILPRVEKYGRDLCNSFYQYWTEKDHISGQMRFERVGYNPERKELFFNTGKRLGTFRRKQNEKL